MPQLNPAPWLMILIVSWLTLLMLFNPKIISATPQNTPTLHSQSPHKAAPWNWPWA